MKRIRPWARIAGRTFATLILASLSAPALPQAQTPTIENTAYVTYQGTGGGTGGAGTMEVTSNTVTFAVRRGPTPAAIDFLTPVEPGTPGGVEIPVDGGECRDLQGEFDPMPSLVGLAGPGVAAIAPPSSPAVETTEFVAGQTIIVRVADPNRNEDPTVREYIEVKLTTSDGDEEVLRLQETDVDTGVFATSIPTIEIPPAPEICDCKLSVGQDAQVTAVYVDDGFPDDTATTTAEIVALDDQRLLTLQKQVSVPEASMGDFLQYQLVVANTHTAAVADIRIEDTLPEGLRYQAGSLRVDGVRATPVVSADGRMLVVTVGDLAAGAQARVTYVVVVGTEARAGNAVNRADARGTTWGETIGADGVPVRSVGGATSNVAEAVVRIREPLFTSRFTIIGQVMAGACDAPSSDLVPVPGARLVMDDGTFVATDDNGAYHFAGVRPGTHVVQLDVATVPAHLQAAPCSQDTRFAGRGHSRFVEADGGALMRADFRLQPRPPREGEVGVRLQVARQDDALRATIALDVAGVDVDELRAMVMLPPGAEYVPGSTTRDGVASEDPAVAGNVLTFDVGLAPDGWRGDIGFAATGGECAAGQATKVVASFETGGAKRRTPPAEAGPGCDAAAGPADSGRRPFTYMHAPTAEEAVSPLKEDPSSRGPAAAAGAAEAVAQDWLAGQAPGIEWLAPADGASSPVPTHPVAIKHAPGQKVVLTVNGEAVHPLRFDGTDTNAARTVAVSAWRGVPLARGENLLRAEILGSDGVAVATLERKVNYGVEVTSARLVPEASTLVADGLTAPVIAVRMLDRAGNPVSAGVSGSYALLPPYLPAESVRMQQQRQLAGMESFEPTWRVQGNDGIAYIELQPTGQSGKVELAFDFPLEGEGRTNRQALTAWLKSEPREWIVVGFAKGTVGHDTLDGNMEGLEAAGHAGGTTTDGQLSLYAKGRVLGKWMLTLAYDSDKPTDRLDRQHLLSTIDPNAFYTLYGDGTQQGHDASSTDKLYLKLERDQFYALFGDFSTGLDGGELTRYHRTLNGLKVEYRGPLLEANAFAAETTQSLARDEIQGDGTSGLYRLSRRDVAINGERVRIEVRDRYRSEIIIESRVLARHLDYDIDYAAGTLFFREPVASRDFDFNPVFIVVEYETNGNGEEFLSAGGRVGVHALDGRLRAGVTYVHDEDIQGTTRLGGVDASYRLTESTELRAEAAASKGDGALAQSGDAYLVEVEHHGERLDALAYVRRSDEGFGIGQQNGSELGMFKAGANVQWRIGDDFSLQGDAWHQENLSSGATRNAANVRAEYRQEAWSAEAGLQWVRDEALDGRIAESRQVTLGARRSFLAGRLELTARADIGLGGRNDSVDFPTRLELGASYALTDTFRVLVAQEYTDGEQHDTSTTRVGFSARPWAGATLTSTLNQSRISEYGPRTFGVLGLAQKFLVGERWSIDLAVDSNHSIDEPGAAPIVVNPEHPIAPGGVHRIGALTEEFLALSGGATYRTELWSLTGRLEHRDGEQADRSGFTAGFLRQATDGVAFSASAQAFDVANADGSRGLLANAALAWAWRPLGSQWSILDRLEYRHDALRRGDGDAVVGNDTLAVAGDASSRRLVNNFVLNYVGDPWTAEDRSGNLFDVSQRSELSLYYGSKYVFDTYDGEDHSGYTDILGLEWRHDLSAKYDVGLRASVRHAWDDGEVSYAFGPSLGFTPFTNAWFSLGYNVIGFNDRDFEAMHYTAQGPYLMMRFKFDQQTFGLDDALRAGR